jgi:hypothetical protein
VRVWDANRVLSKCIIPGPRLRMSRPLGNGDANIGRNLGVLDGLHWEVRMAARMREVRMEATTTTKIYPYDYVTTVIVLQSLCASALTKAPKPGFGTGHSSLGHLVNPDADELITQPNAA